MRKLSKTNLWLFVAAAISLILDFVIDNSAALGIGSKVVTLVVLIKALWDLYNSFTAEDVIEFTDTTNNEKKLVNGIDLNAFVNTRHKLNAFVNFKKYEKS